MLTMIHMEMLYCTPYPPARRSPSSRPSGWCGQSHLAPDRSLQRLLGGVRDDFRV